MNTLCSVYKNTHTRSTCDTYDTYDTSDIIRILNFEIVILISGWEKKSTHTTNQKQEDIRFGYFGILNSVRKTWDVILDIATAKK